MEKPRLTYQQFLDHQKQQPALTISALIERFITVMDGLGGHPPVRPLGLSHRYGLRRLQRFPIGAIVAPALTKTDVIRHCEWRHKSVCPATTMQDVTTLSGVLKYAGSAWDDCAEVSEAPIAAAKPFLLKHGLIAPSIPRDRRPSAEEIHRIAEHFDQAPKRKTGFKRVINMVLMTLWQWYSARRISESCRARWPDWNREEQTLTVYGMKDPKRRGKIKVVALTNEAQQLLIALWDIRDPLEPRIFPYRSQSVSAAYTHAKKKLGIVGLRMHDSRGDRGTRLIEDEGLTEEEAIVYTGHEDTKTFRKYYKRIDPAKIVRNVRERAAARAA